jgi:hypothetical protein
MMDYTQRQELKPALLRANKTVHREASSLLYALIRSDFAVATPEDVASFLRIMAVIAQTVSAMYALPCHISPESASAIDTRI